MKISGSEILNHVNQPEIQQTNNRKISANLMQSVGLETDMMRTVRQMMDKVEIAAMQKMKANYETIVVDGSDGNDEIRAKDLIDSKLNGGKGDDDFYLSNIRNSSVDGGEGDDTINIVHAKNVTVNGGTGDDIIRGSGLIKGDEGNDIINGAGIISGGTGNDIINMISTLRLDDYSGSANIIQYEKGDGHDIVNIANQDTILDMRSISKDEVDILESVNENTGYKELTVTMKDGSGSITFISNNENDELYANAAKVRNALEDQGLIAETPDKPVTFIPEYIHFSDGVVTMER